MRSKVALLASIFLILLGLAWISSSVQAAPDGLQVAYPSPTPQPNGQIIYIVKAGETCTQISILYGVSIDYLRNTNQLDADCTLREGQKLQLGTGGPPSASPTPGPSLVPTLVLPTPTPIAGGKAKVCVLVFNDVNGDGLRQTSEVAIAGAAISLTSLDGTYSQTLTSVINPDATAYQGICFPAVPMGKYNVSAAAPDGYNPTINLTSTVDVTAGDIIYIDYGAQEKTAPGTEVPQNKPSALLGIIGAAFLLVGIGIAIYVWSLMRRK
jgi:LysM repeat protein